VEEIEKFRGCVDIPSFNLAHMKRITVLIALLSIVAFAVLFLAATNAQAAPIEVPYEWADIVENRLIFYDAIDGTEIMTSQGQAMIVRDLGTGNVVEDLNSGPGWMRSNQPIGGWYAASSTQTFGYGITRVTLGYGVINFASTTALASSSPAFQIQFKYEGGVATRVAPAPLEWANLTRLTRIATTTISGTGVVGVDVSYWIELSEINPQARPDYIEAYVASWQGTTTAPRDRNIILPLEQGSATTSLSLGSMPDGDYVAFISFGSLTSADPIATLRQFGSMTVMFTVTGGTVVSSEMVSGDEVVWPGDTDVVWQDCGITALQGCLTNAGLFLVRPSADSIETLQSSWTTLQTKIPFVWVAQSIGAIGEIAAATTPKSISFTWFGENLELLSATTTDALITTTVRTTVRQWLGWAIWSLLLIALAVQGRSLITPKA